MKPDKITAMDVVWNSGRRECIKEFKELIKNAIKEAKEDVYGDDDVREDARAFQIIRDAVENM